VDKAEDKAEDKREETATLPASTHLQPDQVLSLQNISKTFAIGTAAQTEVLHGLSLTLNKGEFCALIGPSGSGKSTLLNLIGLLDRPTSGQLLFEGRDTGLLDDAQLTLLRGHRIGFVFQYHYLLSAFTALENVMMPMLLEQGHPTQAMRDRGMSLLEEVGLTQWCDHLASNMSGGQQQRVAIARALALQPALILADEPTGNLDTQSADSVFALMRRVCASQGGTFLMVTHNMALASRCDRIIELVDGRIIGAGVRS
jgi:lipoprotein-releasing system ATP-binding protein